MTSPVWPPPEPFTQAIRGGLAITYRVSASYGGDPVEGAQDLRPTGGSITDTTKPGVRRVLTLELAGDRAMFERLSPIGTLLTVVADIQYHNKQVVTIPMGVFDVDAERMSEGDGTLSLTAPDKWVKIQRAQFIKPRAATRTIFVTQQITNLIQSALGVGEEVVVTATSTARIRSALVWEKDRAQAIIDLAASIGAWVFFDRFGVCTIADVPAIGSSADWLVDASASGVLIELDRERSRTNTRNVVVVESSAADGAAFATQVSWDGDPSSPTYAGTNPMSAPETAGPFGIVPHFIDTPLATDAGGALRMGKTVLARVIGLASQVSLGQVPNPAVDAFDVIDVLPPGNTRTVITGYLRGASTGFGTGPFGDMPLGEGEGALLGFGVSFGESFGGGSGGRPILAQASVGTILERHIVDTVTHGLDVDGSQHIDGRSTRTDDFL